MKRLWLLVFPICLLMSCLTGCRPPFGGAVWSSKGILAPPEIYVEEGGAQHFLANHAFLIYWCNDTVTCTPKLSPGPCTQQVESTKPEKADGKPRYVGTCVISKGASNDPNKYRYAFHWKDKNLTPVDSPPYDYPANIHPCTPRCSKVLHSQ
jgi:hypothetical protein